MNRKVCHHMPTKIITITRGKYKGLTLYATERTYEILDTISNVFWNLAFWFALIALVYGLACL